jgi:cell wall-associated NlpC family hydrolase
MQMKIKSISLPLIVHFCLLLQACSTDSGQTLIDQITISADSLKSSLAPDSRVALVDYSISQNEDGLVLKGKTNLPEFKSKLLDYIQRISDSDIIDSLIVLPDSDLGQKNWALICVSVANLRGQAGHSKELVTQAVMGCPVRVLEKQGGWYRIQTPDKYLAWVESASLHLATEAYLRDWKNSERVIFLEDFGVIRSSRDEDSEAISDVVFGSILTALNSNLRWIEVELPDGRSGFLKKQSVANFEEWSNSTYLDPNKLIDLGQNLMGRPYLWGGTSTKGVDCSGFVKTLYFSGGVILSRDASQQVMQGEEVNTDQGFNDLSAGDLLFFGRKAQGDQKERITHVGMYIGDGHYIHSSGMVKVNSLFKEDNSYSQYLVDIFVKAKRIVNSGEMLDSIKVVNHPWYN